MSKRSLFKDLVAGRTYQVQVRAAGDHISTEDSDWSDVLEFTADTDQTSPDPPTNLSAVVSGKLFYASWSNPADSDGVRDYEVTIYPTGTPSDGAVWRVDGTFISIDADTVNAIFGSYEADLTFTVASRGWKDALSATVSDGAVNGAPSAFTLSGSGSGGGVVLSWTDPGDGDIDFYEVLRDDVVIGAPSGRYFVDLPGDLSEHDYKVRAHDVFGSTTDSGVLTLRAGSGSALDYKDSVRVATTANIDLASAPSSIDDITLASGDRVLVMNQTDGSENGIYEFNGAGAAMTRAPDADSNESVTPGLIVAVEEGTESEDKLFLLSTDSDIILGTTSLTFEEFSGGAGTFTENIGDGTNRFFTITHMIGSQDVVISVRRNSYPHDEIGVSKRYIDANTATVSFASPPEASEFRVVVKG